MIKLFQRDILIQAALLLVVLALMWIRPLIDSQPMSDGEHPAVLYALLCQWMAGVPRLAVVLAMVLVLAEGIGLNLLLANTGLTSQKSLLPALLYIIAASTGASTLTPILLVNAMMIASLNQLALRGTLLTIPAHRACGATALIGLATLFYQPAVWLMVSYMLVAANYRLYSWRDWAVMILGFAAPYLPLFAVLYMNNGFDAWWQTLIVRTTDLHPSLGPRDIWVTLASILLAITLLWGLVDVNLHLGERPVLWQKNAATVMLMAIGSAAMLLYQPILPLRMATMAVPFSLCTYQLLARGMDRPTGFGRRKKALWFYDLLLIVILITAMIC